MMRFNFEKMSALARDNPHEFSRQRSQLIDETIRRQNNPDKARRFQNHIDHELRRAKTPFHACLLLYAMMWDTILMLEEKFQEIIYTVDQAIKRRVSSSEKKSPPVSAKILEFRRR